MAGKRLLLVLLAVLVAGITYWRFFAGPENDAPAQPGMPMVEVTVPTLEGAALSGEVSYNERCAVCHGKNAAGQAGVAPPLVHKIYEPGHHGDQSFYLAAKNGVRAHHWQFGNMPPVADVSENEMTEIITYVRTLQRANGIN